MLSEYRIQDAFHSYLKSSLKQAKLERLLDTDVLTSAEADLMIAGPALCLYFAALRSTTNPPSVPLPQPPKSAYSHSRPLQLTAENCPPAFTSFLNIWAETVPYIQSLEPEYQHDLARIICGLSPLTEPPEPGLHGIAAQLRAIALGISQRRSFQDRFAADLQAVLDSDGDGRGARRAMFVPPPVYEPTTPTSPSSTRTSSSPTSPHFSTMASSLSPSSDYHSPPPSPSPTIFTPDSPAIDLIRETLYAALADTLEEHPSLLNLLKTDPSHAYFAALSLAILSTATHCIDHSTESIIGVLGTPLSLEQCPTPLVPFMAELVAIGDQAHCLMEDDYKAAVKHAQMGEDGSGETRLERVKRMLLEGIEYESMRRRRSEGGRTLAFANRIGGLALAMTRLSAFRERQDVVFGILAGIRK